MRHPVSVTYNGNNDRDHRTVSLNKACVERILGCLPEEVYVRLYHRATGILLVEGPAAKNKSGRYYLRGTQLPAGYPLRSDTDYVAEVTNIVEEKRVQVKITKLFKSEPPVASPQLGKQFMYVGITQNGRVKFGMTDDIDARSVEHRSLAMEPFMLQAAWELTDRARTELFAERVEQAAKDHFVVRAIHPRKEWLEAGTPMGRVIDFLDERLRLVSKRLEFESRIKSA